MIYGGEMKITKVKFEDINISTWKQPWKDFHLQRKDKQKGKQEYLTKSITIKFPNTEKKETVRFNVDFFNCLSSKLGYCLKRRNRKIKDYFGEQNTGCKFWTHMDGKENWISDCISDDFFINLLFGLDF